MIRLALFGHGRWGKNILRTLESFPDVSVTVVPRGQTAPAETDGVILATPIATHAELALPFISRGTAVFIEKPVTDSVADAKRLLAAAKKAKTLVHVGHIHLHNAAFAEVQKIVPTLGPIRYMTFEGFNNGPFRDDASVLWDWLPHPLSMMVRLMKKKPISTQAWGINSLRPRSKGLYDIGFVRYTFAGGVELICSINWLSPEKRTKMMLVGKKSALVYNDVDPQKIWLYENFGPTLGRSRFVPQMVSVSHPHYEQSQPLERELRAFVDAIQKKSHDSSELAFGLDIVRIIEATHASIKKGGAKVRISS